VKVGVLALQGAFEEHLQVLGRMGVEERLVRLPKELEDLDALIIPGGESTSIGKLADWYGLIEPLRDFSSTKPIMGTCGGLVFMSKDVGMDQPLLGIMDTVVLRNAFGRQVDSFEQELDIEGIEGGSFHGVFIRAPIISSVGPEVKTLCALGDGRIVAVRQGRLLAISFHPELTRDDRVHRFFLDMAQ
jgi:5'-phosphate synthase pdxT subunit